MNDMSRPQPMPTTADHEQHDALLISRLAADDPLDQADYRLAMALVSGCTECASLAGDLRTVATAVAWEPVPPRRRDFRLSPEQAERARGSGLQRFMRRLALPQSNGLRPLAAGVMSLGLVLVVAGNFWPQDVFDGTVQQEVSAPGIAPAATDEMSSATTPPGGVGEQDAGLEPEPATSVQAPSVDDSAGASGAFRAQDPDTVADDDTAADAAAGMALEAATEEVAVDTIRSDAGPSALESPETSSLTQELAAPELSAKVSASPLVEAITDAAAAAPLYSDTPAAGSAAVEALADTTEDLVGDDLAAVAAEDASNDGAELAISHDDGISIEMALVAVGLGLFVAGLSLWLLLWIARRRDRDLLAR